MQILTVVHMAILNEHCNRNKKVFYFSSNVRLAVIRLNIFISEIESLADLLSEYPILKIGGVGP